MSPQPAAPAPLSAAPSASPRGRAALAAALLLLALSPSACVRACSGPPMPAPRHVAVEVATGLPCTGAAAVSATDLWLATTPAGATTELQAMPKGGGPLRTVASFADSLRGPLVVHRGFVYFAYQLVATTPITGVLVRVPESGGAVETLAAHEAPIADLDVADDGVFWLTADQLRHVPLAGGPIDTLASGFHFATALALDGGDVAWITSSRFDLSALDLTLRRVPRAGGTVQVVTTWAGASLLDLAVSHGDAWVFTDEGHAHTPGTRAIDHVAAGGGRPSHVVIRESDGNMVADAAGLYWTETRATGLLESREGLWDMGPGPAKPTLSAVLDGGVSTLMLDPTHVYALVGDGTVCTLVRIPR